MATITKITVQKKNTDRYNIFLDHGKGEEYAFSVDEDVLIKFNLKKGMELDDFALMEINYQDDIRKSYNLAIHYLTRVMRTEFEVRKYLADKEVEEPVIQEVIHKLYDYQFLDDEEYANAYVRTQINTSDKGIVVVRKDLQEKGVAAPLIEKALKQYSLEKQIEKAKGLWEKAVNKSAKESERILKQKAEQFLLRKGYPFEVISIAMEMAESKKDEDDEMEALRYQGEKAHRKYAQLEGYEYEQKMKQALYRKGFSIEKIEQFLAEEKDD
ncbi:recombination regulator RecX [Robertmurraya yapensis]|uniref:Regulatory protein RecX n=1 Tax=Bacillus yapensis TaxID=2492960 RepID=A0A431VSE4_9BACI|nr:recombination regulator RecX [Bacillus yapensis]RTR26168.1 recombination regulator RecX [Bacillus yapensis]TKS93606.1 recombination regulator RecX [Bacillus yapensis]